MAASLFRLASIPVLCRANIGLLQHKLDLIDVMRTSFGRQESQDLYRLICPIVHASIGQHIRHSMDHIDLAIEAASSGETEAAQIHYDTRRRNTPDESDIDQAEQRINATLEILTNLSEATEHPESTANHPVNAYFMLSGDPEEFILPSTIERELGFAAHHAIHHMALVKIIAIQTVGVSPDMLSSDFGRAPSTIVFHNSYDQKT